jgi:hypothetical protein
MTEKQAATLRSLARSVLFAVAPIVMAVVIDPKFWGDLGVSKEIAVGIIAVGGALIRAYLPDVFGSRPTSG